MDSNLLFALLVGFSGVALLLSILGNIAGSVPMHAFLYSAIWAVCIGASEVALGGTIRPDVATTLVLFGAWWAFLVGSILPLIAGRFRGPGAPARIRRFPAVAAIWVLMALQWCGVLYEVLHVDKSGRSLSPSTLLS